MLSKQSLAIFLSKLKIFSEPKIKLEQYPTDSEIGADLIWNAYMQGDIEGKKVIDLGAGTGILGIAALILGAKEVHFVEIDKDTIKILNENIPPEYSPKIHQIDIKETKITGDTVIMNPPFGAKKKHADKEFLEIAIKTAPITYSLHKKDESRFLEKFTKDNKTKITHRWNYSFPLKASYKHHKKKIERIETIAIRIKRD